MMKELFIINLSMFHNELKKSDNKIYFSVIIVDMYLQFETIYMTTKC